jgi:hypothetical protein
VCIGHDPLDDLEDDADDDREPLGGQDEPEAGAARLGPSLAEELAPARDRVRPRDRKT